MRVSFFRIPFAAVVLLVTVSTGFAAGPKIGVLLKGRSAFWKAAEKGALEAGEKAGVEILLKAPLNEADVSVQIQMLNALAAQGIDALVIAPCSKDALTAPVAALAAKGIKIVVVDSPLAGEAPAVFVATDNRAAGVTAGQFISKLVSDSDEICILRHSQTSGATGERETGALTALREAHPFVTIHAEIYASTEKGAEAEKATLLLDTYPHAKVVLASGTLGTMAMLHLLQEKKSAVAIKLVGFGFNLSPEVAAAIEAGQLEGWIAQFPQDMGAKGVIAATALVKGEPVDPIVRTAYLMVTKANLKTPEVQALLAL